jgi:hypothetical protein
MQLALEYGIEPKNMALAAMAGIAVLLAKSQEYSLPSNLRFSDWRKLGGPDIERIINWLWKGQRFKNSERLIRYVQAAKDHLIDLSG